MTTDTISIRLDTPAATALNGASSFQRPQPNRRMRDEQG